MINAVKAMHLLVLQHLYQGFSGQATSKSGLEMDGNVILIKCFFYCNNCQKTTFRYGICSEKLHQIQMVKSIELSPNSL